MGNKCSCFDDKTDNKIYNLSNVQKGLIQAKSSSNNDVSSDIFEKNECSEIKDYKNYSFSKYFSNTAINEIPYTQITNLSKKIRGFLLRKKYKAYLKQELINFQHNLYETFKQIAQTKKVSDVLLKKEVQPYLETKWTELYQINPVKELTDVISNIKLYKNGIRFKYTDKKFHSDKIQDCLESALYAYKGDLNLYTNKKCGEGKILYRNGIIDIGTFYEDVFQGWNTRINASGIIYVGLFVDGNLTGKGIRYTTENDHSYIGDFVNGLREGKGVDKRINSIYDGEFKSDKKWGYGKISFDTGDSYEGGFENNKFSGQGHYIWKKNGHEYIGGYKNGQFHGKGFYKWGEKEYYKGDYVNGVKEGLGEIAYPDGKKFIVTFKGGKPDGIGIYEDSQGNKGKVQFVNGKLSKKLNYEDNISEKRDEE